MVSNRNPHHFLFQHKDIYIVLCCHLDLQSLANLAQSCYAGSDRFTKVFLSRADLILTALLRMPKNKIAKFLRQYPAITEHIRALKFANLDNPAAFALWALVTNVNEIDQATLSRCIDYFTEKNHVRVVRCLRAIQFMLDLGAKYQNSDQPNLSVDNTQGAWLYNDCYINLRGLRLSNHQRNDATLLLDNFDFSDANLQEVEFNHVTLSNVSLLGADLRYARLSKISKITSLDCRFADFRNAYISQFDLCSHHMRLCYLEGANFTDAHFFSRHIITKHELYEILDLLPRIYLTQNDKEMVLCTANHHVIKAAVLQDLIRVINNYSEDDFIAFTHSLNYALLGVNASTLLKVKILLLQAAHEHQFFKCPDNMLMYQLGDFLVQSLSNKQSIYTASQRVINQQIDDLKQHHRRPGRLSNCSIF